MNATPRWLGVALPLLLSFSLLPACFGAVDDGDLDAGVDDGGDQDAGLSDGGAGDGGITDSGITDGGPEDGGSDGGPGCPAGTHDGGDGSCVPEGLCQSGTHDGGDGSCVLEGTCSADFLPSASGACVPVVPCSAGLEASPAQLLFGDLPVGDTSTLSVVFTNPAAVDPCSLVGISIASGSSTDFFLPAGAIGARALDPGQSISVDVTFTPSGPGAASGFVTASFEGGVRTVRLLGQGLDVGASVTPTTHDFGAVAFPCAQGQTQVCVSNSGGVALAITSAQLTGSADFSISKGPAFPHSLVPGATACFTVTYVPGEVGTDTGELVFSLAPGGISLSVPLAGEGAASGTSTDTFLQTASAKADILWVMDSSCSMFEEQLSLSQQAPQLIGYLEQQGVDYQIAVVSMDATTPPTPGMMEPKNRSRDHIVKPTGVDPAATFSQNVKLGTGGSGLEQGFDTARLALSEPLISDPVMNGTFIRPDAYLSVIFVSDEPEQSVDTFGTYLSFFRGVHGTARPDLFIASAFVGPPSTSPINPGGCVGTGGSAAAGPRFWDLAAQTGGAQQSICTPDWGAAMQAIASSFGLVSRFPLSAPADAASPFVVEIIGASGGITPAAGWSYDAGSNAIDFDAAHVPQPGETVRVTYTAACP